jgi:hypothetical protein
MLAQYLQLPDRGYGNFSRAREQEVLAFNILHYFAIFRKMVFVSKISA